MAPETDRSQRSAYPTLLLMERTAPEALTRLRERFPAASEMFRTDQALGQDGAIVKNQTEAMQAVIAASTPVLRTEIEGLLDQLSKALTTARKLQLIGSMIAAASSGGLLGLLIGLTHTAENWQALMLSAVSFFSSVIAVLAEWIVGGKEFNAREMFEECTGFNRSLLAVELKLRRILLKPESDQAKELEPMLETFDELAVLAQTMRMKLKLG